MIRALCPQKLATMVLQHAKVFTDTSQAFHTNAQHDSLVSSSIAEAAKRDSYTTKAISVLGMVFLPGTFISVSTSVVHLSASNRC